MRMTKAFSERGSSERYLWGTGLLQKVMGFSCQDEE